MKQRNIILITAMIMTIALTACQKEQEKINDAKSTMEEVELTPTKELINSISGPTVGPTLTIAPVLTPTAEPAPSVVSMGPTNTVEQTEALDTNTPFLMDTPPFNYYIDTDVQKKEVQPLELSMRSSKANKITDDEDWFIKNNLSLITYQVPNRNQNLAGNLPSGIDATWNDLFITSAFYDDSYIYCTYGPNFTEGYILKIYNAKSLKAIYFLDFSNYNHSPDLLGNVNDYMQQQINWAMIKDNILYFSISHNIDAKMNAYITAINLSDLSIVWRTDPLVSNAYNFIIIDDVILCGYGFSGEPDFLYQINKNTGEILEQTPLKSMASYIINKEHSLYVRTYNTNYVFDIVPMKDKEK